MKKGRKSIKFLVVAFLILIPLLLSQTASAGLWFTKASPSGFGNPDNAEIRSMAVFNQNLYAGTYNNATGCEIWRHSGTSWSRAETGGFGAATTNQAKTMIVYNSNLYVGTNDMTLGCQVHRYDGSHWTSVAMGGFGDTDNISIDCAAVLGGFLYVGTGRKNPIAPSGGCEIWRFNGTSWAQVNTDGFGFSYNSDATSMAVNGTTLFVGTANAFSATPGRVWRYNGGTNWTQVNVDGFGHPRNLVQSMTVFQGCLYVGTYNDATGCEIWRYDGATWAQVNSDGFGDVYNKGAPTMAVHMSHLYVGTLRDEETVFGCEVWSYDGSGWSQAADNGFNNSLNFTAMSMTSYNSNLHVGTDQIGTISPGGEIWRTNLVIHPTDYSSK